MHNPVSVELVYLLSRCLREALGKGAMRIRESQVMAYDVVPRLHLVGTPRMETAVLVVDFVDEAVQRVPRITSTVA